MHIETITFDRVFSVCKRSNRGRDWTDFGFEAGSTKVYSAQVGGHPVIREGVKLAIATSKPGAWTTIYGWAVLGTGQVVVEGAHQGSWSTILMGVGFNLLFLPLVLMRWHLNSGAAHFADVLLIAVPNLILGSQLAQSRSRTRAHRALTQHLDEQAAART